MQEMQVWSLGGEDPLEEENGNPLQYSCLENSMNRGAWWATVHGVSKNWTGLSYWALSTCVLSELKYMKLSLHKICPWCCQLFYDVYRICQHPIVNWHRFASLCCALSFSHVQVFATPWTVAHKPPLSMVFSGQAYWVGYHLLLQKIFQTRDRTQVSRIVGWFSTVWATREALCYPQIRSDQSLSRVELFATPWIAARQASLSIINSRSSLRLTSIESMMPIQPSHPLSSPSPPAPNPSQHQSLFQWVNSSHEVAKVLEFQL